MSDPRGYLIRGGDVYDGTGAPPRCADVRIAGDRIMEIAADLAAREGEEIVDARGLIVAPGLIDLHVHVFSGVGQFSVAPADAGLKHGVTTLLDTGTAGALTFPAFERFVISQSPEDIYALLNISLIGAIHRHDRAPHLSDLTDARACHVPSAVECIRRFRGPIVGVKARLTVGIAAGSELNERAAFHGVLEAAAQTGVPCMFHHAASSIPLEEVLGAMRPGDVYTHAYHPLSNGPFTDGTRAPRDATRAARDRGVIFDVGHGVSAFAWDVAEPACQQYGFWPDTISTDVHRFNLNGPVFDLPTTMTKFLYLGMPLTRVIRATTSAPAAAMGLSDRLGTLTAGRSADVTLLRSEVGSWELIDVAGQVRIGRQRLVSVGVFKAGRRFACRGC